MDNKSLLQISEERTLHDRVCSILRQAILKGDFRPGERLIQADVAKLIGVSRMPVREALQQLEVEGLVTLEPHRGAVVNSLDIKDIEEIYELRSILEPIALEKSMDNLDEVYLNELKKTHAEMKEATSEEKFVELNTKFHKLLIGRCDNSRLLKFIEMNFKGFPQDTPQVIQGQITKSISEHESILKEILNNNKEGATKSLASHINRTVKELKEAKQNHDFKKV